MENAKEPSNEISGRVHTLQLTSNMHSQRGNKMGEVKSLMVADKENMPNYVNHAHSCSQADFDVQCICGSTSCFTQSSGQRFVKRRLLPEISSVSSSLLSQFEAVADSGLGNLIYYVLL